MKQAVNSPTNIFRKTKWYFITAILLCIVVIALFATGGKQEKILVFTQPQGEEMAEPSQVTAVKRFAADRGIRVDLTASPGYFNEDSLRHYGAVVFLNTLPDALNYRQQADFERYVQAGGGFFVLHAASDTVRNWPWYETLKQSRSDARSPYWETQYDGGRAGFYSAPDSSDKADEALAQGLNFVFAGRRLDYGNANSLRVPEANRFIIEVLDTYMYEPMEMVAFRDGRVLYIERRGDVKLYEPANKKSRVIAAFDVSTIGNYEDGLLGVALDPDYEKNNWIYFQYSPAGDVAKQNVSRFMLVGDSLMLDSEKIILEIPTQRETCCHSAGHLEFGPDGNLYISTGDNTSSKESNGYSPIDERAGRGPFDAQKSSGNTNDLRGKILRIHPEPDGSYTIPEGNLFPEGMPDTRPEIYVMGTRNAFRFTVDKRNGFVYWGDVGPDSGKDSEQGPQSYDEWNQARKAGNFGWPYFVGDNYAYPDFDFALNKPGPAFDPDGPENASPNNTGMKVLPPAQKPMIWYPYGESREFPELGKGSRSAMGGPVYYAGDFPKATRFPDYYDGKWFIYEWARSWIKVVSFDADKNLAKIEPFLPEETWYKPIDIKFGHDGSMYVMQYGSSYFARNADSRLVKITYVDGNRQPIARLTADRVVGAAPLTVNFSAAESFDYDKTDKLRYAWKFDDGTASAAGDARQQHTFSKPGIYHPTVTVNDNNGKSTTVSLEIKVGNEPPRVTIDLGGANRSFYYDDVEIQYRVSVTDKEDGTLMSGIDPANVFMSFDYLNQGRDLALLASNPQMTGGLQFLRGKRLIEGSDCKSCHALDHPNIGPSYMDVARHYYRKPDAPDILTDKILRGGSGTWGKNMMAAHPQHTKEEAMEMVRYILSLSSKQNIGLPLQGAMRTSSHVADGGKGIYVIRVSYADKGDPVVGPLTENLLFRMRNPKVALKDFEFTHGIDRTSEGGKRAVQDHAYFGMKDIDLTSLQKLAFRGAARKPGTRIEIRLDSTDGPLIGSAQVPVAGDGEPLPEFSASLRPASSQHDLYIVFRNDAEKVNLLNLDWVYFDNGRGPQVVQ